MNSTRIPAVAGLFYPADPTTLQRDIQHYLDDAVAVHTTPRALIVPHAGYIYSGPVAATAYKTLYPLRDRIKRVLLLGPSHRVAFNGMALPESNQFQTPLGTIKIDTPAITELLASPGVIQSEIAHQDEHSLEVQLPFLQQVLGDFVLIPVVIGQAGASEVATLIEKFWDDEETLIIISSDLSHYHTYTEAQQIDGMTSDAIVQLEPEKIGYENACGRNGVNGLLTLARARNAQAELLDLRNSGDTAGDRSRVVGYGAYAIH